MTYKDRTGNTITQTTWHSLQRREAYKRIEYTELPCGIWVSTIWTGIENGYGEIFETMVRLPGAEDEFYLNKTEARAIDTHDDLVKSIRYGEHSTDRPVPDRHHRGGGTQ